MKVKFVLLIVILLIVQTSQSQNSTYVHHFNVGETIIAVEEQCYTPCKSNIVFVHLHDNEKTSIEAAQNFLMENGGRFIRLINDSQRNVLVVVNNKECCFDPNRMYCTIGIKTSLKELSVAYPTIAENEVKQLSSQILKKFISKQKLIVSLHNNSDTNYSISQIRKDIMKNEYAGKYFINKAMDEDDFILTTDLNIYNQIVAKNINVVWENFSAILDDGSLSIYAGKHNIPYINIETQHEHKQEQIDLLQAIKDIILKYRKK